MENWFSGTKVSWYIDGISLIKNFAKVRNFGKVDENHQSRDWCFFFIKTEEFTTITLRLLDNVISNSL
jgi:hypothetical protein